MGFLTRLPSVIAQPPMRASVGIQSYLNAFWQGDTLPSLSIDTGADAALALTHVYSAVDTISSDFGVMTCQMFEDLGEEGNRRVKYSDPGIGALAFKLRWQPNAWQTAKAFWSTLAWQYLLRPAACAEIIYRPGLDGFVDQVIPRHPDRVKQERLPSGEIRFKITEPNGQPRYLSDLDMMAVRNKSMDGLNALGRLDYGAAAISGALALQDFTTNWFNKGATAALIATYKGTKEEEDEKALHGSIMRYLSGPDNAGGLLVLPEDIDVKALSVDPEKSQLLGLKNISGRDVARMFKLPPAWLGIEGAASYGSQVQDAENYKNRAQMPLAVEFEQSIQRDLVVVATKYFAKFNMDYLTRADLLTRFQAHEIAIRSRIYRPSTAQRREDLPVDYALDKLSEGDFRPGTAAGTGGVSDKAKSAPSAGAALRGTVALLDTAARCCKRERAAVAKLAVKHAADVEGWQAGLRDFLADQAQFIAETMRVDTETARGYVAQHGAVLEERGVVVHDDAWERSESVRLAELALGVAA